MVNYSTMELDEVFGALASKQRRDIIAMLRDGPRTISELAKPLDLSFPAIHKHLKMLERARLIDSIKRGRTSHVTLQPMALLSAQEWLQHHKTYWNYTLDALENFIDETNRGN